MKTRISKQEAYSKFISASSCAIAEWGIVVPHPCGDLFPYVSASKYYRITLTGAASKIPAKSNDQRVFSMKKRNPITGKVQAWNAIRPSTSVAAQMDALRDLYTRACCSAGMPLIRLGTAPSFVLVKLAQRRGRWDSHNTCKAVGDFLQDAGIIDDDCFLDIFASRYVAPSQAENVTEIFILPSVDPRLVTDLLKLNIPFEKL